MQLLLIQHTAEKTRADGAISRGPSPLQTGFMSIFIIVQTEGCLFHAKLSIFTPRCPFWHQLCMNTAANGRMSDLRIKRCSSYIEILWYAYLLFFYFPKLNFLDGLRYFVCTIFFSLLLQNEAWYASALVCLHEQHHFICQTFNASHQTSQKQELQQTTNMSQHGKNRGQLICTLMLLETTGVQKPCLHT